jgi:hypothetical protein
VIHHAIVYADSLLKYRTERLLATSHSFPDTSAPISLYMLPQRLADSPSLHAHNCGHPKFANALVNLLFANNCVNFGNCNTWLSKLNGTKFVVIWYNKHATPCGVEFCSLPSTIPPCGNSSPTNVSGAPVLPPKAGKPAAA